MSDETTALETVNGVLERLVSGLQARDLVRIMSFFSEDAVLFGSEAREIAHGASELRAFFESIVTQPVRMG